MNFGQIRQRVEIDIGRTLSAATLANWIDDAQLEISLVHGNRGRIWYPLPTTYLSSSIHAGNGSMPVDDTTFMPVPPVSVILGSGELYEVIRYTSIAGNSVEGITRGLDGTEARSWAEDTPVREMPQANAEYPMADDILDLHEVRDISNNRYFRYQISKDKKVVFFDQGQYYLSVTRTPEPMSIDDSSVVPEVHSAFHPAIVQFCIGKHWESIAEGIPTEENKAMIIMQQFQKSIEKIGKKLNRIPNQQYTIGTKLWS